VKLCLVRLITRQGRCQKTTSRVFITRLVAELDQRT
jgi:hypothetical protein